MYFASLSSCRNYCSPLFASVYCLVIYSATSNEAKLLSLVIDTSNLEEALAFHQARKNSLVTVKISSMPFHCPKLSSSFHVRFGQYKSTLELFCSFLSHIRTKYEKIMIRRSSKFQHCSHSFSHNLKV